MVLVAVCCFAGATTVPALGAAQNGVQPAGATSAHGARQITSQLPRTVRPLHYEIAITPDSQNAAFAGNVTISLEVLQPTAVITLNAADLRFTSAVLSAVDGGPATTVATAAAIAVDAKKQTASVSFSSVLARGRYRLTLQYTGVIETQPAGLFSIDYDTPAGRRRALYTQFENADARRLIPSWDEPAYKASFSLQATVPGDQMAVSNMPIASQRKTADGHNIVTFATTPVMSTYLLFFATGEFERTTAMVDGTEIGVVTKKGSSDQAAFALDASTALLREYNAYFGVPYSLPKLDNVAAPGRSQFFGAMENWGAIFTFEHAMLLDPAISTQTDKQAIFSIAAHEIAHQWFGDLVTMQWWDDLWLNEGFASWMESRTTARMHPEWQTALGLVHSRERAMQRDSLATTHPVVQHIETVEQANQAFDSITYSKGETVLHMLENYVGEEAWRTGVRAYMKAHAFGNTVSDDLWRQIELASQQSIAAIAQDFTLQPGVPMLTVDSAVCKDGNTTLSLTQGEFSRDVPQRQSLRWRLPVVAQVAGATRSGRALIVDGKGSMKLPGCGAVVANAGQTGYYRTRYAPKAFAPLAAAFPSLPAIDQLGVLADTWSLGLAGQQPMHDFLTLAAATPLGADPQVWAAIAEDYATLHRYYDRYEQRQQRFDRYAIGKLAPVMARVGWNATAGEADAIATLRNRLIETLGELGDSVIIGEARRRAVGQASQPGLMPGPIRKAILSVVARHADAAQWDALRAAAAAEKSPMIKDQLFNLLAAPQDPALAARALELAMTPEPGATNSSAMISRVANGHPDLAFDFAIAHRTDVDARVDPNSRSRYYPQLATASTDAAMPAKLDAYARAYLAEGSRRDADTAKAEIAYRIKVRATRLAEVDAWLARS